MCPDNHQIRIILKTNKNINLSFYKELKVHKNKGSFEKKNGFKQ